MHQFNFFFFESVIYFFKIFGHAWSGVGMWPSYIMGMILFVGELLCVLTRLPHGARFVGS